jgi:hypothetical protein
MRTRLWLQRLCSTFIVRQAVRSRRKPTSRVRPHLDVLEDRTLPAPVLSLNSTVAVVN